MSLSSLIMFYFIVYFSVNYFNNRFNMFSLILSCCLLQLNIYIYAGLYRCATLCEPLLFA